MMKPRTIAGVCQQQVMSAIRGSRVLFVEDNEIHQTLLLDILARADIQVVLAEHGQQALTALSQQGVDLVLMDCQMPVMDGLEASRQIRQQPQYQALPIIALTAATETAEIEQALASGMNAVASKPVEPEQLFALLYQWLPDSAIRSASTSYLDRPRVIAFSEQSDQPIAAILTDFNSQCVPQMMALKKAAASGQPTALAAAAQQIEQAIGPIAEASFTAQAAQLAQQAEQLSAQQVNDICQQLISGYQQLIKDIRSWQQSLQDAEANHSEQATSALDLSALEGIDVEAGLKRCGGDAQVYRNLLVRFAEMYNEGLPEQSAELAGYIHGMKGAAAYLGITAIVDLAVSLEQQIAASGQPESGHLAQASTRIQQICRQLGNQL
ncbi:response regulator [Neiella sp. HB171785]|uniref:Response regulator n=1 Tax=Neiella litorisoli TaxID=2771431 RepID=A0A8J6QEW2_9GAMM|nr:response regulator [Neiella litorisoli]MBD1388329.1 response regulator [Neiella litorisoli]